MRVLLALYRQLEVSKACNFSIFGTNAGVSRLALAGGLGGCGYWISVFPTDTVKSRIQVTTFGVGTVQCVLGIVSPQGLQISWCFTW